MSNKYRNKPVIVDGIRFASKKEAKRHQELVLLERAGQVRNLFRQPRWPLVVNGVKICIYVGDFQYEEAVDEAWRTVVEDTKGFATPLWKLKFKLADTLYPNIVWRVS